MDADLAKPASQLQLPGSRARSAVVHQILDADRGAGLQEMALRVVTTTLQALPSPATQAI